MPRKNRTPASKVLNRENQRRSRARHREFIGDLRQRISEYERRDAQATLEMQQVARVAAAENAALREMLAARHVSRDEIDAYVVSRNSGIAQCSNSRVRSRLATRPLALKQAVPDHLRRENAGPPAFQSAMCRLGSSRWQFPSTAPLPGPSPEMTQIAEHMPSSRELSSQPSAITTPIHDGRTHLHSPHHEATRHDSGKKQPQRPANNQQSREDQTTCAGVVEPNADGSSFYMHPIDPACYCPPEPPQWRPLTADGMSCLEAAIILAQFRGQPDSSLARAELGCAEGTDCVVQNTDVLQLMDKTT